MYLFTGGEVNLGEAELSISTLSIIPVGMKGSCTKSYALEASYVRSIFEGKSVLKMY